MYWNMRSTVLLPPFLTEAAILQGESDVGELLKIFARSITEWAKEEETTSKVDKDSNNDSFITIEADDAKLAKPGKAKQAAADTLNTISDDCEDVLAFLQAVAVKYPRVIAAPLSLCADKSMRLFPTMDRRQPTQSAQDGPTIPPGSHGHPDQRVDPVAHHGSAPPRHRHLARGGKIDKGVGRPPTNIPARHPGVERYHQNLHSDLNAPSTASSTRGMRRPFRTIFL